jgi:hypothetical protein
MQVLRVRETRWPEIVRSVNPAVQTRHDRARFHLKNQEADTAFHAWNRDSRHVCGQSDPDHFVQKQIWPVRKSFEITITSTTCHAGH